MKKTIDFVKIFSVLVLFIWILSNLVHTHRKFVLTEAWVVINSTTPIFNKLDALEESLLRISDAEKSEVRKKIIAEQHGINGIQGIILSATDKEISDLMNLYDKKQ